MILRHNSADSAASSAVACILILAAVTAVAALWFAAVYPIQLHESEEKNLENALAKLTDIRLMMDAARFYPGVDIAAPLPAGSLVTEKGVLYLNGEAIPVSHLSLSIGGTAVGIAANGIWRQDAGGAAWRLFPQYQLEKAVLTLEVITFENDLGYGSTEMIPYRFSYSESVTHTSTGNTAELRFTSEIPAIESLWETCFQEIAFVLSELNSYESNFDAAQSGGTLYLSGKEGVITVQIIEHRYFIYAGDFV